MIDHFTVYYHEINEEMIVYCHEINEEVTAPLECEFIRQIDHHSYFKY